MGVIILDGRWIDTVDAAASWIATKPLGKGGQGVTSIARRLPDPVLTREPRGWGPFHAGDVERMFRGLIWDMASNWDDDEYVIKLFAPRAGEDADTHLKRWQRELRFLRGIDHPNVARMVDAGRMTRPGDSIEAFSVYRYYSGGSLEDQTNRFRGQLVPSLHIAIDILRGLEQIHAKGVLHRDIKPANIFLDASGRAVLGDLGLISQPSEDPRLTQTGATVGNWQLAPPWKKYDEGYEADVAYDVYMACMTLWSILGGVGSSGLSPDDLDDELFDVERTIPRTAHVADLKSLMRRVIVRRRRDVTFDTAAGLRSALTEILEAADSR